MKIKLTLALLTLLLTHGLPARLQAETTLEFVTYVDYPGAKFTLAQGINDAGDVTGYYTTSDVTLSYSFVRYADGTLSAPISVPMVDVQTTRANAINNNGVIAGEYTTIGNPDVHGFFFDGTNFSYYDYPGATQTIIYGLNDAGDFVGTYVLGDGTRGGFSSIGGVVTNLTVPGGYVTLAGDINNAGQIIGSFSRHRSGGFRIEADGTLHYPISVDHTFGVALFGLNESNESVGVTNIGFTVGVYVVGKGESYIYYSLPGTSYNELRGINARGLICGFGTKADGSRITGYILRRRGSL